MSVTPVTVEQGFDALAQPKTSTPIEMEQSTEQVKAQLQKKLHSAVRRVWQMTDFTMVFSLTI